MQRSNDLALVCLLPLLFAGCDSDDVLSLIDTQDDAAVAVASASNEVLVPVIQRFNLIEVFGSTVVKTGGIQCTASDECSTGTWDVCTTVSGFEFLFDACILDGEMVSGSLTGVGSDVAGTVDYAVTVDDLSYAGFLTFTQSGDCFIESFSQFSVRDGAQVSILGGELTYCPGSDYPTGTLSVSISGTSSYSLDATFDGTQSAVIVFDGGTGSTYDCTSGLATGGVTCQ